MHFSSSIFPEMFLMLARYLFSVNRISRCLNHSLKELSTSRCNWPTNDAENGYSTEKKVVFWLSCLSLEQTVWLICLCFYHTSRLIAF